jgi:hypothetical protein
VWRHEARRLLAHHDGARRQAMRGGRRRRALPLDGQPLELRDSVCASATPNVPSPAARRAAAAASRREPLPGIEDRSATTPGCDWYCVNVSNAETGCSFEMCDAPPSTRHAYPHHQDDTATLFTRCAVERRYEGCQAKSAPTPPRDDLRALHSS